ncbi:SGNH/GDSL hydrolase family protein [Clostridium sp.]|uniref:SGNH/GDSL hydrolase family protein n=1 Tax=Clostridium sp. TaxID=1506 RepID=UPI003D6CE0A2
MRNNIAKVFAILLIIALIYLIGYGVHRDRVLSKKATEASVVQKPVKENTEVIQTKTLKYKDKNWMAIGDEITSKKQYQKYVQEACEFKGVETLAEPGITLHIMDDKVTKDLLKDIDVVTVFAGVNDFGDNRPLGSIEDSTLVDTFYSDMKAVIENIEKIKPEIEIIFIATPYIGKDGYGFLENHVGSTLEDYTKAMSEVCALYDVPVVDLYASSGISKDNLLDYSDDSIHPNEAGVELIGKVIGEFLNR